MPIIITKNIYNRNDLPYYKIGHTIYIDDARSIPAKIIRILKFYHLLDGTFGIEMEVEVSERYLTPENKEVKFIHKESEMEDVNVIEKVIKLKPVANNVSGKKIPQLSLEQLRDLLLEQQEEINLLEAKLNDLIDKHNHEENEKEMNKQDWMWK
jgi:hypothetical protein